MCGLSISWWAIATTYKGDYIIISPDFWRVRDTNMRQTLLEAHLTHQKVSPNIINDGHLLYEPIHAVLRENRYPKISLILIFPIRHLPVWGIMWVKQCHKPSPSHHHQLICIYIYIYNVVYTTHSQSWLVKMALFYQPSPHQTGRPSGMLGFSHNLAEQIRIFSQPVPQPRHTLLVGGPNSWHCCSRFQPPCYKKSSSSKHLYKISMAIYGQMKVDRNSEWILPSVN